MNDGTSELGSKFIVWLVRLCLSLATIQITAIYSAVAEHGAQIKAVNDRLAADTSRLDVLDSSSRDIRDGLSELKSSAQTSNKKLDDLTFFILNGYRKK